MTPTFASESGMFTYCIIPPPPFLYMFAHTLPALREMGLTVFSLWSPQAPSLEVDLFVDEPFDFDDAYGRALRVPLQRTHASVIAREDLIAMKRSLGRPRDREDVEALEELGEDGG